MILLKHLFTILHIITAAAWFGLGLRLSAQARKALSLEPVAGKALAEDALQTVKLMGPFLVLTLVFGLLTFVLGGGFGVYGPAFHTSLLLLAVLLGVHYALIQPSARRLLSALEGSSSGRGDGLRKRLAMGTGIGHLIWLVILVLMFSIKLEAALS